MPAVSDQRTIALIAVDLDGTLLRSDKSLAPRGTEALRRAARSGVHVVLATTRNPEGIQTHCTAIETNSPLIATNGAQVWASPKGPIWRRFTIPLQAGLELAGLADQNGWELVITVGSKNFYRQRPGQLLGPMDGNTVVVGRICDALTTDPLRILTWQPEAIKAIREICQTSLASQCKTETYYNPDGSVESLGVFAAETDKGTALEFVCAKLGIPAQLVMAIGDNPVDLPMFHRAGLRVAMGNGTAEIKQAADWIAPGNDDEGVAWAVE